MYCPFCKHTKDHVIDSRPVDHSAVVRRRRECSACHRRFTTYERLEDMPLMVIKQDGSREPYNRNKLRQGIMRACEKRPVSSDRIEQVISVIDQGMQEYLMEVTSQKIGLLVLEQLFEVDPVAYVRFASVYRRFDSIDVFLKELRVLKNSQTRKKLRKVAVGSKND